MAHRNARTTVYARRLIVQRWLGGWPAARIAEQLGISRATVHKWIRRYRAEGWDGLADRSSRPHHSPTRTCAEVEDRVLALRATARRGPVFLARELGLVASTVGRILRRRHVLPLRALDPVTGIAVRRRHSGRRYEHPRTGDLVHVLKNSRPADVLVSMPCPVTRKRTPRMLPWGSRQMVVAMRCSQLRWMACLRSTTATTWSSSSTCSTSSPTGQSAMSAVAVTMNTVAEAKNGSVARWCSHCPASGSVR